jgi:hypothetical protein
MDGNATATKGLEDANDILLNAYDIAISFCYV